MPPRIALFCLLVALLFSATLAISQETAPPPKRPKIGLVLEGGGALGLAHVGVLQYFEEHRIPVSYVAGTSMGGLVGGIYATGYSATQMTKLVHEIDWDDVLRGQIPFRDLAYRRKEDAIDYPNSLEFGIKHGVKFPSGFNSGYLVGLLLDRIALPYSQIKNFDELPTPFACVATDLVSSERLVLRDGSLAAALRSTMSLPGIFTPMRTKKAILVDGGLLDNLPVDVALEMGAQFTIAIHLESRDLPPTESLSSVGVLGQSISAVISANENRSKKMANILISVPLTEFTSLDYEKDTAIIKKGYEAAAGKAAELSAYSVSEAEWNEYLAQRKARQRTVPIPQFVEVIGTKPYLATNIERELGANVGKPVDTDELDRQLTLVVGDGRYSRLGFGMVDKDGQEGLQIQADEKQYGPPFIRPLLLINGSAYNNPQFNIGARITFLDVGGFGSEWRSDVAIGYQYLAQTEYYHPLKKSPHWFMAPRLFAVNTQADYYRGNTFITDYSNRQSGGAIDAG
ncbi:MAG: patatin-like phospholipase family protein, partial [Terriglobales bacterium]